jgi:hypothetical protein
MSIDYSERDAVVRHNVYASVRRRDGLPQALFANYWRDVHATVCSRLPGLGFYVQQHFNRDHTANLWPLADGVRTINAIIDGSAELGFASVADQSVFAEAGTILYADEFNLFSESVAYNLPTGSTTYVDRQANPIANGPDTYHRVHVYMTKKAGTNADTWLSDTSAELAAHEAVIKWKLHLPSAYDNGKPAPPAPNVSHTVEDDRLNLAVAEVAFVSARTAREFFQTPAFQKVFAAQGRHIDAIGAYLVSDFFTFVRDGVPTTAGIRGSRQAELIETVGAANQLVPDVARRFRETA